MGFFIVFPSANYEQIQQILRQMPGHRQFFASPPKPVWKKRAKIRLLQTTTKKMPETKVGKGARDRYIHGERTRETYIDR